MRLALAVSILIATSTVAHALDITLEIAQTRPARQLTPVTVYVTIRNSDLNPVTIEDITHAFTLECNSGVSINRIGAPTLGVTLMTGDMAQYQISHAGYPTDGIRSCSWLVLTDVGSENFETRFNVIDTMAEVDPQPHQLQMGSPQAVTEQQTFRISNPFSSPVNVAIDLSWMTSPSSIKFAEGTCANMDQCTVTIPPAPGAYVVKLICDLPVNGTESGIARITPQLGFGSGFDIPWTCTGMGNPQNDGAIDIMQTMLFWNGAPGTPIIQMATIGGDGNAMQTAFIAGPGASAFKFKNPFCGTNPQFCMPMNPVSTDPPFTLDIECTPDGNTHMATLNVNGIMGPSDGDSATLECTTSAGGPTISVNPTMVDAMQVPVGTPKGMMSFDIQNDGDANLVAQILYNDSNWTVSDCKMSPCTIAPGAANKKTIDVTFTPTEFGDDNITITVDGGIAGMPTIAFNGEGVGETLLVTTPHENHEVLLGTIGKNQLAESFVTLASDGNVSAGLVVDIGANDGPVAPFSTSASSVMMSAVDSQMFAVRCQSATPGGPHTDTISITSSAYQTNTMAIVAKCTIVNTLVQVTPTSLDFGEVRVMPGGERTIGVTIKNPGPPVMLDGVTLSKSIDGLSLSAPGAQVLATDQEVTATIRLATDSDTELEDVALRIDVDENLSFPITGKVVTPKAYITPADLDLGSACLGSSVTGNVMLVNDGTATLHVQPPTMTSSFTPLFVSPTTYPSDGSGAPLSPRDSAIAGITPSASAVGTLMGTLSWSVDAPGDPFEVPVRLETIEEGAALSPRVLGFGSLEVDATSAQQKITLQNCNAMPIIASVNGLVNVQGGVDAWDVQPVLIEKPLGRHDKLEVFVRFAPKRPGKYAARLQIVVDGEMRFVDLTGEADGVIPDRASLYACNDCSSGGSPSLIVVVLFLICRRRTGSSSAR